MQKHCGNIVLVLLELECYIQTYIENCIMQNFYFVSCYLSYYYSSFLAGALIYFVAKKGDHNIAGCTSQLLYTITSGLKCVTHIASSRKVCMEISLPKCNINNYNVMSCCLHTKYIVFCAKFEMCITSYSLCDTGIQTK